LGGSGTTAYVAEQWGRRWITIDTSRVALALSLLSAGKFPRKPVKEVEITRTAPTYGNIRHGFVYERGAAYHAEIHHQ
jgi:adenine-specific DNA-methyltransferase